VDSRTPSSNFPAALHFGRIELRPAERVLLIGGQPAVLGARAFDLLLALAERPGRLVSKHELIDLVWPGVVVEENNLQVQVSALRKLLGGSAITTIPGRGYRFTAAVNADLPTPAPPAPVSRRLGLPALASPLIGRDDALRDLMARIAQHRLVTIVGAGGIGKTVLAQAAAAALADRWRDGCAWVELAPLADGAMLAQTVAQALSITLAGSGTPAEQLVGALRGQQLLLVLDNCEHVVDAVSRLAGAIAAEAPGVHLLATSQELLNVGAEHVLRLGPLSLPAPGESPEMRAHGAVALFVGRAQASDPRFALGADNADAVADICRRLDGLPLAIELAAARVHLLGVQGVRERLDARFKVLTGGARTALRRHQTLRATIEWSHALLTPDEQAVLRRLGVFVGGFSLVLAQQVCIDDGHDEWAVLDAIGTLVDKSLVAVDAAEPPRYRLLETTRAYALEQLGQHGETARMLQRHAHAVRDYFVLTEAARFGDGGTLDMDSLLARLRPEFDNWRAALDWAAGDGAEPATAVALAGAGAIALRRSGLTLEMRDRLLALQPLVDEAAQPMSAALFWSGLTHCGVNGRLPRDTLLAVADRSVQLLRGLGSRRRLYVALCSAAWVRRDIEQADAAEAMWPQIVALERANDPLWLRFIRLNMQGVTYLTQGRHAESAALFFEQVALLQTAPGEETSLATARVNLCVALIALQRFEEAIPIARAALPHTASNAGGTLLIAQVALDRLDDAWQTFNDVLPAWRRDAFVLRVAYTIAPLLARRGQHEAAARLHGAATAHTERTGTHTAPGNALLREILFRAFDAAALAADTVERWRSEGAALDEAQAAALCAAALDAA
jgi:predicted ATPase/DNA-binding winged helix-turn-helix (wHTH) protein